MLPLKYQTNNTDTAKKNQKVETNSQEMAYNSIHTPLTI